MKQFNVKILARDCITVLKSLSPKVITEDTKFTSRINSVASSTSIKLNVPIDDFGEGEYIDFMNIVEIYSITLKNDTQIETLIFKGFIEEYNILMDFSGKESVEIIVQHVGVLLTRSFANDSTNISVDPSQVIRNIIDNFNTIFGGSLITYTASSLENTGLSQTFSILEKRHNDAIQQALDLSPANWYYYIDATGVFHFHLKPSSPTHIFTLSKDIKSISASKSIKELVNHIKLKHKYYDGVGYSDITTEYDNAASQLLYGTGVAPTGKFTTIISNRDILTTSSASDFAQKKFDELSSPIVEAEIIVTEPYNIESIKVGDTCRIAGINSTFFESNMQIVMVMYNVDDVKVTIGSFKNDLQTALKNAIKS